MTFENQVLAAIRSMDADAKNDSLRYLQEMARICPRQVGYGHLRVIANDSGPVLFFARTSCGAD